MLSPCISFKISFIIKASEKTIWRPGYIEKSVAVYSVNCVIFDSFFLENTEWLSYVDYPKNRRAGARTTSTNFLFGVDLICQVPSRHGNFQSKRLFTVICMDLYFLIGRLYLWYHFITKT